MKTVWWLASLAYMAVIFFFSAQNGSVVGIPAPWDKLAHGAEYTGLGFLLFRATGSWRLAWVLAAWYGALDELHQAFVPEREAGIADWWADLLGSFLGARLGGRVRRDAARKAA